MLSKELPRTLSFSSDLCVFVFVCVCSCWNNTSVELGNWSFVSNYFVCVVFELMDEAESGIFRCTNQKPACVGIRDSSGE